MLAYGAAAVYLFKQKEHSSVKSSALGAGPGLFPLRGEVGAQEGRGRAPSPA